MFHTYVTTASGSVIDFDRASFLMDKTLLQQSLEAMREERDTCPRHDADYGAQWVWDYYSQRHMERYGEPFEPDIIRGWDSSRTLAVPRGPLPRSTP